MLYSAVQIIGDMDSTTAPYARVRTPIASGFIIDVPSDVHDNLTTGFVVTAAHNLKGQTNIQFQAPGPDGTLMPPLAVNDWVFPSESLDLAVAQVPYLPAGEKRLYWSWRIDMMIPVGHIETVGLGSPIFYVGLLAPLERLMARSGTIGAVDQFGIEHEYPEYDYPCHLVDCRSYGGFSGSPCYMLFQLPGLERSADPLPPTIAGEMRPHGAMMNGAIFCGMFTEHLTDAPGTDSQASRYGVGVMLRSQEIREAILGDKDLSKKRKQADEDFTKDKSSGPKLRSASRAGLGDSVRGNASKPLSIDLPFEDAVKTLLSVDPADLPDGDESP